MSLDKLTTGLAENRRDMVDVMFAAEQIILTFSMKWWYV